MCKLKPAIKQDNANKTDVQQATCFTMVIAATNIVISEGFTLYPWFRGTTGTSRTYRHMKEKITALKKIWHFQH